LLKNTNLKINKIEKKKHGVVTLYDETKKLADAENKIPVIALCQKHRKGFWIVAHANDLEKIINARNNKK
jgi:hypothetical protein